MRKRTQDKIIKDLNELKEARKRKVKMYYELKGKNESVKDVEEKINYFDKQIELLQNELQNAPLPKKLKLTDNKDNFELSHKALDEIIESVNNYLCDNYGFCNNGFGYSVNIELDGIDWDTTE